MTEDTKVLIVGGGLAGLSAALFLAWRGVPTVLVEKHAGSSPHPRAIGFTTRTLELFRAVGLGSDIPQLPAGQGRPRRVAVESLAGKWSPEVAWSLSVPPVASPASPPRPVGGYSPCTGAAIAQDRLEPILRAKAIELGADVRMSTEMTSMEQDPLGVTAWLRRRNGTEYAVRADYVIAADGHSSPTRQALGIGRSGHGFMRVVRSIMFRAPLDEYLAEGISQFELDQPGLRGMLTTYRDGRWLLMVSDDEDRDEAALAALVTRAIGRSDVPIEVIASGRWVLSALIADRFSLGRVHLVGDAAHTLPPARGGYGANTGIEDSFNLAWKLASVLSGTSSPALLDTYDAERRPIAWLRHDQIFARQDYAQEASDAEKAVPVIEDDAMELGQLYRSTSVLGAGHDLPPAQRPEQWAGQPGTRAQHLWIAKDGERLSTLDLLQRGWTLLSEDPRWGDAASRLGEAHRPLLTWLHIGVDLLPPAASGVQLTLDTPIEQIVAHSAGKAVLDGAVPELTPHEMFGTFKSMSLRHLQPMSEGLLTDAKLASMEADLAGVQVNATTPDSDAFAKSFRTALGIGPTGASLIRPDGYVAWRAVDMPADPAAAVASAVGQVAATAGSATAGMSALSLEDRIRKLEDIEAIKDLMSRYALHINKGWNGQVLDVDQFPSIFTEDVRWDSPDMKLGGTGLAAIMTEAVEETASIDFSMHSFTNPVISVDGDGATGNWLMWVAVRAAAGARQVFLSIDLEYLRTSGGWRIDFATVHVGTVILPGVNFSMLK